MEIHSDLFSDSSQTLNWLLEEENPAIKYRTLTEICESSNREDVCH